MKKKLLPNPSSWRFYPMFTEDLIALYFYMGLWPIFDSFMYKVWPLGWGCLFLPHMDVLIFQHYWLDCILSSLNCLLNLSQKSNWLYFYESISGLSILFCDLNVYLLANAGCLDYHNFMHIRLCTGIWFIHFYSLKNFFITLLVTLPFHINPKSSFSITI